MKKSSPALMVSRASSAASFDFVAAAGFDGWEEASWELDLSACDTPVGAEACAAEFARAGLVDAVEAFEDALLVFLRKADSGVHHRELRAVAIDRKARRDGAAARLMGS
jgi:hypothetical protein